MDLKLSSRKRVPSSQGSETLEQSFLGELFQCEAPRDAEGHPRPVVPVIAFGAFEVPRLLEHAQLAAQILRF